MVFILPSHQNASKEVKRSINSKHLILLIKTFETLSKDLFLFEFDGFLESKISVFLGENVGAEKQYILH